MTPDSTPGNDSAQAPITVAPPVADLAVTKTGPATVVAGSPAVYTIDVVNNGPSTATTTTLTDVVPAGVSIVGGSSSRGSCNIATLTCALGDLPVGATATITVNAVFDSDAPLGAAADTAGASSAATDPTPADNSDSVTTTVTGTSDLSIVKTADSCPGDGRPAGDVHAHRGQQRPVDGPGRDGH